MLENDLHLPFETQILGVTATVESIDITGDDQLVAVCGAGKTRQRILLSELPLPSPPPAEAEWIAAYRKLAPRDDHAAVAPFINSLFVRHPPMSCSRTRSSFGLFAEIPRISAHCVDAENVRRPAGSASGTPGYGDHKFQRGMSERKTGYFNVFQSGRAPGFDHFDLADGGNTLGINHP